MAAQRDAGLLAQSGPKPVFGSQADPNSQPTLADAGIDKHLADRARKMAAIPADEFDGIVSDWRERVADENARVTVNLVGPKVRSNHSRHVISPNPDLRVIATRRIKSIQSGKRSKPKIPKTK
jgi:hypothetical protein